MRPVESTLTTGPVGRRYSATGSLIPEFFLVLPGFWIFCLRTPALSYFEDFWKNKKLVKKRKGNFRITLS